MTACPTHSQRRTDMIEGVVFCQDCNEPLPKLYSNRVGYWHKNMGPPEYYVDCCWGSGVVYENEREMYCKCEAGQLRKDIEK